MTAEAPLRVGVTGGREYADPPRIALVARVEAALRACLAVAGEAGLTVAHGANPAVMGGDVLAGRACARLAAAGLPVAVRGYPADVRLDGPWPATGNRRNSRMVAAHQPQVAAGFPDPRSRGTWHCLAEAAALGADLLVDLAALGGGGTTVGIARARLLERGCSLGPVEWADGWLARGPLAERLLEQLAAA